MTDEPSVGTLVRRWRADRGITQFELAARCAVSTRHLSVVETGKARASRALVERLVAALELPAAPGDLLRSTAGFAPGSRPVGDRVFSAALAIEGAMSAEDVAFEALPVLTEMGVTQFFFGRMGPGRTLAWYNPGTFPRGWLEHYEAMRYAEVDPLLALARRRSSMFGWEDAVVRPDIPHPVRRMFDDAAAAGITRGYVLPAARANGAIDLVSMMGRDDLRDDGEARTALRIVAAQMLDRLASLPRPILPRG